MSYIDMVSAVRGSVPKLPMDLAYILVADAWEDVKRQSLWSFQVFESNWTSPPPITAGRVSVTQAMSTVTFDATASAAITTVAGPTVPQFFSSLIRSRQFRVGIGTIYNIWDYAIDGGGSVTLTLDRPYQEATATAVPYMVYQCYYPAPYQDFVRWESVRDILNYCDLNHTCTRVEINQRDPQRSIFYIPTHCVPYQLDMNPVSLNYQSMLFELWGQPSTQLTYQLIGIRNGPKLANATDTLPPQIGEDCVRARAKYYAYEWAMANAGDQPRGQGTDYKFLMAATEKDYERLFKDYRKRDREAMDNFRTRFRRVSPGAFGPNYSSIGRVANPGPAF